MAIHTQSPAIFGFGEVCGYPKHCILDHCSLSFLLALDLFWNLAANFQGYFVFGVLVFIFIFT